MERLNAWHDGARDFPRPASPSIEAGPPEAAKNGWWVSNDGDNWMKLPLGACLVEGAFKLGRWYVDGAIKSIWPSPAPPAATPEPPLAPVEPVPAKPPEPEWIVILPSEPLFSPPRMQPTGQGLHFLAGGVFGKPPKPCGSGCLCACCVRKRERRYGVADLDGDIGDAP